MQPIFASLFIVCLANHFTGAVASGDHPIEKVIAMLKGLSQKVEEEGKAEEVTYTTFDHWCGNSFKTLEAAIKEEKEAIDSLNSEIAAKTARMGVLSAEITSLETEIGEIDMSTKSATLQRSKEAALDSTAQADYDATIAAIKEALEVLQSAEVSTDGFLQRMRKVIALVSTSITDEQRGELAGLLREREIHSQTGAGPAPAPPELKAGGDYQKHIKDYAFKSNSVIELLKGLLTKFEEEKLAAVKAETNSLNAFSLASDARENAKTAAEESKDAKTKELSSVTGEKTEAEANLEETKSDLEADSNTLAATQKQCALKKSEWADRSSVRKGELEAMSSAISILSKVTGVRTEAPENPIPPASPVSLLQFDGPRSQVIKLLRREARESHSRALERLAQEIAAHSSSPFAEVNNMIQKMIFRLMDEQKDEDNHKNWCDLELDKTNTSKVDKTEKAAVLTAKIDAATATVQALTEDITKNSDMIAAITSHMEEATEIRETGKKENAISVKDSEDAQTALVDAIAVLETFYKETGMVKKEAWEFVQRGVKLSDEPATWGSSYTGVADPNDAEAGIIALLKGVSSEFAKMEADTKAQEATDQDAFEEDMKLCSIEKARREKESQMKDQEKKRLLDKTASMTKSKKEVSKELEAVEQYLKDLEPACIEGDSTYEARKADRSKEISALHEAQAILQQAFSGSAPAPAAAASSSAFLARVRRAQR